MKELEEKKKKFPPTQDSVCECFFAESDGGPQGYWEPAVPEGGLSASKSLK
jgi:hypothetical protein